MGSYEYISIEGFKVRVTESTQPHSFRTPKNMAWLCFCARCGLVHANNKLTQKALRRGCMELKEENLGRVC